MRRRTKTRFENYMARAQLVVRRWASTEHPVDEMNDTDDAHHTVPASPKMIMSVSG